MIAGTAPYPRNQWYVAASVGELEGGPLQRWLLDTPVVLYRGASGEARALLDRCPHRGLPLSQGRIVGDTLQCRYHGMRFDGAGRCVDLPSGGPVSDRLCVTPYPLVQRWQWLWIWMGDPELTDPAAIPDIGPFGFGREDWCDEVGPLLPVAANYLLPFENLLDASHISFLHHGLIDSGDVAAQPFTTELHGDWMRVSRFIENETVSPLTQATFAMASGTANRTITADAHAPNLCGIRVDITGTDNGGEGTRTNQLMVGITPVSRGCCMQFTAIAQNFPFANPNREADVRSLLMEDVEAMESIQALIDKIDPAQCQEVSVNADAPAMRMRRRIIDMLAAEGSVE